MQIGDLVDVRHTEVHRETTATAPSGIALTMAIEEDRRGPSTRPKMPMGLMPASSRPHPSTAMKYEAARSAMALDRM